MSTYRYDYWYPDFKFYSFKLGPVHSDPDNAMYMDIKLPAPDPKYAIIQIILMFRLQSRLYGRKYGYNHDARVTLPDRGTVELYVRQVIEWKRKRTPQSGYTRHTFKKQRILNPHDYLDWFPEHPDDQKSKISIGRWLKKRYGHK